MKKRQREKRVAIAEKTRPEISIFWRPRCYFLILCSMRTFCGRSIHVVCGQPKRLYMVLWSALATSIVHSDKMHGVCKLPYTVGVAS